MIVDAETGVSSVPFQPTELQEAESPAGRQSEDDPKETDVLLELQPVASEGENAPTESLVRDSLTVP